jgi:hypothetical protein
MDKAASFSAGTTARRSTSSLAVVAGINFARHFLYLALATLVLAAAAVLTEAANGLVSAPPLTSVVVFFSIIGSLHATTLVFASIEPLSLVRKLSFIAYTGVASIGALFFGFARGKLPHAEYFIVFAASAFGGIAYWCLIRAFIIRNLRMRTLSIAVAFCEGGTLAGAFLGVLFANRSNYVALLAGLLPTVCWWYAFSLSLWLVVRHDLTANKRLERSRELASSVSQGGSR